MFLNSKLTIYFLLVVSCTANTILHQTNKVASSQAFLDPNGNLQLKWTVDYSLQRIAFELVISEQAPMFNWVALGFSGYGEMDNADACLLWTDYNGQEHFQDVHTDDKGKVINDQQQDCEGFYIDTERRSIIFERSFDTCDDEDYVIDDGTTHVIWAHGTDMLFDSKGLCLSCTKDNGFIRVRLLTPPPQPTPPNQKSTEIAITNDKVRVPAGDTTYWCKVQKLPELITEKNHHIIQFESIVTPGNEGLVHHMEVFYCDAGPDVQIPLYEGSCFAPERPEITKTCSKVKAAWALGALPFIYPSEAGLPLGGPDLNQYVMLEVHYNNPTLKDDWIDSSGIMLHVTSNLRRYNAAVIELGLEYIDKMAIPAGQNAFPLSGHCIPECTGVSIPSHGIIVFGSQLHTHLTGVAVWTRHVRNGIELPVLNRDMHYSQHFQEIRLLHKPVQILPGDYLETTCIYRTLNRENATIGGHATTDEMCVNYLHYYPATQLEVCKSSVSTGALHNYFNFEKSWDNMPIDETASSRQNYLAIKPWTPLRVQTLYDLYRDSPISMQCNASDGNRFQGDWEDIPIPKINLPLPKQTRDCPIAQPHKYTHERTQDYYN